MGSNRNEYSKQPASKVSINIRNELNIEIKDIYAAWTDYNYMRKNGATIYTSIQLLKKNHSEAVFNYFISMSLELINVEIISK
jgi:hypothetical protein